VPAAVVAAVAAGLVAAREPVAEGVGVAAAAIIIITIIITIF
jgi:hypothetical protein